MIAKLVGSIALAAFAAGLPAAAADKVKIGFVSTLSGPQALLGKHQLDGFMLAVKELNGKVGGLPAEITQNDDQFKPDVARQLAEKLVKKDQADIVTGLLFSNVLMAMYNPIVDSKTVLISSNAGASQVAGKSCSPYFFTSAWQTDQAPGAVGRYVKSTGAKRAFIIASNYQAGQDAANGFKRQFNGQIVQEIYPPLNQPDFSAEISQIAALKPDAVFVFIAGSPAINFVKQYAASGLRKDIPLYSAFTVYGPYLETIGEAAIGARSAGFWTPDLENPANKRFVEAFRKEYGYVPSNISAQAYESLKLIDAAVTQIKGKVEDRDALVKALETARYESIRGPFKYGKNHFPIQNFYATEVAKLPDGKLIESNRGVIVKEDIDPYAAECPMK
ncbi:MAG: ABC transporter substrate-binding protein [Burkholderiaceae bacterium]|nr:ABC transporter substrate-binding protein [Burkholderiaceae bacterium]